MSTRSPCTPIRRRLGSSATPSSSGRSTIPAGRSCCSSSESAVLVGARRARRASTRHVTRSSRSVTSSVCAGRRSRLPDCPGPWRPRRGVPSRLGRGRATRDLAPSHAQAEAVSNLAGFYALRGDPDGALSVSSDALDLAEALDLDEIRAESLTFRGHARILGGDLDGIRDLEQAVQVAEETSRRLSSGAVPTSPPRSWSWDSWSGRGPSTTWSHGGDGLRRRARPPLARGRAAVRALLARSVGRRPGSRGVASSRGRRGLRRVCGQQRSRLDPDRTRRPCRSARGLCHRARVCAPGEGSAALCPGLALRARVLAEVGRPDEAAPLADEAAAEGSGRGVLASFWTADLADVLHQLGRRGGLPADARAGSRWLVAAHHLLGGSHADAAAAYAAIGARPEEARAGYAPRRRSPRTGISTLRRKSSSAHAPSTTRSAQRPTPARPIRSSSRARARSSPRASSTGAGSRRRPSRRRGRGPSTMSH